jgi:hypothetical protein
MQLPHESHPTIIECNPRCPCWPHCPNSTLQRGPTVHLELFKTDNGRGFGVRTREDIQRWGALIVPDSRSRFVNGNCSLRGQSIAEDVKFWKIRVQEAVQDAVKGRCLRLD